MTIVQVCLLAVTLAVLAFTLTRTQHIAVPTVLLGIVLIQLLVMIRSVQAHVEALEEFFAAINYEDFTRHFVEESHDIELKTAFNKVIEQFQVARVDRDLQAGYLDTIIRHIPVALFAARDGSLTIVNHPARRLTGVGTLTNIADFADVDPALPAALEAIEPGQQRLLQTRIRSIPAELRVSVAEIRMAGDVERLYCVEKLSGELSARESSAWRNLIRVLTHEIMNTLTPVTSLAQTTVEMLGDPAAEDDIREAIATIGRRSDGMINFVSRYRELLQVPKPTLEQLNVNELLRNVATLERSSFKNTIVTVEVLPDSLHVFADRHLLEQVIINLVKNAGEALVQTDDARIVLAARLDLSRTIISVTDNGPGIPEDALDQVFIPFFTTKREGSGVGLSWSRQIMTAHNGEIAVESGPCGTVVRLVFN